MAGEEVGALYYTIEIKDGNLTGQLQSADKKVKEFGDNVGATGERIRSGLVKAAKGFAIVGAGLTLVAKQATDFTVDLVKESKSLGREIGVSTTEASRLVAAFSRMGLSSDTASAAFGIFSKNIVAATKDTDTNRIAQEKLKLEITKTKQDIKEVVLEIKKHKDKTGEQTENLKALNLTLEAQQDQLKKSSSGFAKLGISTKKADGTQKDFKTLLFEVADKFKAMPDGIDKTALSMELFGRQGKDLIKVLNLGGDGILDLEKKAEALGLTLNEDTISAVSKLIESKKKLKDQTDALKISIGTATAPIMTAFNTELNKAVTALLATDGPVRALTVGFIAFGGPVFGAVSGMAALTANMIEAWPAIMKVKTAMVSLRAVSLAGWAALVVADIYLVIQAAQAMKGAFDAVNAAQASAENLAPEGQMRTLQKQATAARERGDTKEARRIANALRALGGNAGGTTDWKGGLTWINEKGPELINLPKHSQVIPADVTKDITKGGMGNKNEMVVNIGTINDRSDADYILREIDSKFERVNMGISP